MNRWIAKLGLGLFMFSMIASANQVKVGILGMVCPLCSQGLKKGFSKVESVKDINVDMENQKLTINLKEGQTIKDSVIKEIVEDAGVSVESIKR